MIEALYGIHFTSSRGDGGGGVVVLETERVLGGDSSFVYIGSYKVKDGAIHAEVQCTNDRRTMQSIFGDIHAYTVILSGSVKPGYKSIALTGHLKENPSQTVEVHLTRRAELP